MHKKQLIASKPSYEDGQLLLADDFVREQRFHIEARYRHTLNLHGWGVVRGLDVTRVGDNALRVGAGFAIDGKGRELELKTSEVLELQGLAPGTRTSVTLGYRTERPREEGEQHRVIDCYVVLRVSTGMEEGDIVLASVQLSVNGQLEADGIGFENRQRFHTPIAPGSVDAAALDERLRRGWLRSPFRPTALPEDESGTQPPFRIGPTETAAHREIDGKPNTRGAAGTMAISLPPQAARIHQLRVAGAANEKALVVRLFRGGWDAAAKKHVAMELVKHEVRVQPFDELIPLPDDGGQVHLETSTLSIEIRAEAYARISLVALDVSY